MTAANEPKEASIVLAILKFLKTIPESKFEKTHGGQFGKAGKPDITGCIRGRRVEIEAKRPSGKVSPLQEIELRTWRQAGALAFVARSVDDVKEELRAAGLIE